MSETRAVDYSFARPTPAVIKANGYVAVGRYIGGSSNKHLTIEEARSLHNAGLAIWLVWEGLADRAKAGRQAGIDDARSAIYAAAALGYPTSCPIFVAVDFDAQGAQVTPYLQGWASVLRERAGVYGSLHVTGLNLCPWRWQTRAWSGPSVGALVHIYQRNKAVGKLPAGCDENVICRPVPMWGPKGVVNVAPPKAPTPPHPPTPAPTPSPAPTPPVKGGPNERDAEDALRRMLKANKKGGNIWKRARKALNDLTGKQG